MITNIGSLNSYSTLNAEKLYVPVTKSSLMYSHFEHVSGVVAKNGQAGTSISKIRILNSLIEHLSSVKNQPVRKFDNLTENQADILIKQYQDQIKQTVKSSPYFAATSKAQAGMFFSFTV